MHKLKQEDAVTLFICKTCEELLIAINFGINGLGSADIDEKGNYIMIIPDFYFEDKQVDSVECPYCGESCTEHKMVRRKDVAKLIKRSLKRNDKMKGIGVSLNDPIIMEVLL